MKDFLVVRNQKSETVDIIEFDTFEELRAKEAEMYKAGHQGELIPCTAKDMDNLLSAFTEYRPPIGKNLSTRTSDH